MAKCFRCQAETELYDSGVPICLRCANEPAPAHPKPHPESGKQPQPQDGKAA